MISDPELHFIAALCLVGLLLTINVILRFPDFGDAVAAVDLFP
jgi:hypothetical protein